MIHDWLVISFLTLMIQQQQLILCFDASLRHFCIIAQLSSFCFQSNQVYTCPIEQIRKGLNQPLQSEMKLWSDLLN